MEIEIPVVIVGVGPAGIATSGCLNKLSIPNNVLESDDCLAPLWRKRTYDRLKLHLGKDYCHLPHMPFSLDSPTFVPRVDFLHYLDTYVTHFNICIRYNRFVETAFLDDNGKWRLNVKNTSSNVNEIYVADYLLVASGENSKGYIPKVDGHEKFEGIYMHCSMYLNGREWYDKNVLVVGSGNYGMEIAYDHFNWGANTSNVIRSPVHYFTKEMVFIGMCLLKFLNVVLVDKLMVFMSKLKYEDMSKYGLTRPKDGPFTMKIKGGRTPTIDVGCVDKIKEGKIKVLPAIARIKEDNVIEFENGQNGQFDVIIFATGYNTNVLKWLKDYKEMFTEEGMPKSKYPNHWKGENEIYCAGFSRRGLEGISYDAQQIANDINRTINSRNDIPNANTNYAYFKI